MLSNIKNNLGLYESSLALLGLILQLIPEIPQKSKSVILYVFIVLFIVIILITIITRDVVKRERMLKIGRNYIRNTIEKIVLFGGDISWADDYIKDLTDLIAEGKTVEVYYPINKYTSLKGDAKSLFSKRAGMLQKAGIKVLCFEKDYGLRCMLIDPDTYDKPDEMKLFAAKRVHTSKKTKYNKYRIIQYQYKHTNQREICKSFLSNYTILKSGSIEGWII